MEITKRAKFTTPVMGGKGYLSGDQAVKNWLESQSKRLLHPRFKAIQDAIGNEKKLEEILSVFNVDKDGCPIIGSWMLLRCSFNAQKLANTWKKHQVSADQWRASIAFAPASCNIFNGKKVKDPDGVDVYTISLKDGRSFFKAYQYIEAGTTFDFVLSVDDEIPEECVGAVLDKMQIVGVGAFRERFGKFEYV